MKTPWTYIRSLSQMNDDKCFIWVRNLQMPYKEVGTFRTWMADRFEKAAFSCGWRAKIDEKETEFITTLTVVFNKKEYALAFDLMMPPPVIVEIL